MKLKLFEYNPKTRMVDLDREWISTIKEFREILKRDKGSEGDMDGRKKLQATKEFTFLYHYCDYGSKFINFSEKDKLTECLKNANLPTGLDIYKDSILVRAMQVYIALQTTPTLKMLNELLESMHTSYRVIKKIRENLDAKLEAADFDEEEPAEDGKKAVDPVDRITSRLEKLIKITNLLPETIDNIKELQEKVMKEMADESGVRGDRQKGKTEDKTSTTVNPEKLMSRD